MTQTNKIPAESLDQPPELAATEGHALISPWALTWAVLLGVLFVGFFHTYLERLFRIVTNARGDTYWELFTSGMTSTWNHDWSHAMVIPIISLYYLYQHRAKLAAATPRINWWGLGILCFGMLGYIWWIYPGRNDMFQGYSMIVALFGLALFVLGGNVMKVVWFPIVYLVFAIRVAPSIWEQIAWRMQQVASASAHVVLQFCSLVIDFEPTRDGNHITLTFTRAGQLVSEKMNVAEACSGLRMLMAFIALGVALAFLAPRPWWQRALMIAMAPVVAIAVNVGRVTVIGLLYLVDPKYAQGDFHTFVGMLMLIPAGILIWLIGWCASKIFIYDPSAKRDRPQEPVVEIAASANNSESQAKPRHLGVVITGLVGGVALAILLGAGYWSLFKVGETDFIADLPQRGMILSMGLMLLILSVVAACVARGALPLIIRARPLRLPMAAAVVSGMLAAAWIGQSSAVEMSQLQLIKKEVPTRMHLSAIPLNLGDWKLWFDERKRMSKEIIEVMGTKNFISRYYLNQSVEQSAAFSEQNPVFAPGSLARVHVAYYSGSPDTVPHVPDRCFIAGGARGIDKKTITLHLDDPRFVPQDPDNPDAGYQSPIEYNPFMSVRIPTLDIPVTLFTYVDGRTNQQENVIYFFAANGKFLATPNQVRVAGFGLRDEYAYYCKIEVSLPRVSDPADAREQITQTLEQFLPEIMACLPDWTEVTAGNWPKDNPKLIARTTPLLRESD